MSLLQLKHLRLKELKILLDSGATTINVAAATGISVGSIIAIAGDTAGQKYKVMSIASNALTVQRYPNTAATGLASA
mgnify:CR=1 FL=1